MQTDRWERPRGRRAGRGVVRLARWRRVAADGRCRRAARRPPVPEERLGRGAGVGLVGGGAPLQLTEHGEPRDGQEARRRRGRRQADAGARLAVVQEREAADGDERQERERGERLAETLDHDTCSTQRNARGGGGDGGRVTVLDCRVQKCTMTWIYLI